MLDMKTTMCDDKITITIVADLYAEDLLDPHVTSRIVNELHKHAEFMRDKGRAPSHSDAILAIKKKFGLPLLGAVAVYNKCGPIAGYDCNHN